MDRAVVGARFGGGGASVTNSRAETEGQEGRFELVIQFNGLRNIERSSNSTAEQCKCMPSFFCAVIPKERAKRGATVKPF